MDSTVLKVIILTVAFTTKYSKCDIDRTSIWNPVFSKLLLEKPRSDPCNPLYWYPKPIPAYCYINTTSAVVPGPIPVPIPIPQPVPLPYGLPIAPSHPMVPVAGAVPVPPPNMPYAQGPPGYPPYQQGSPGYPPYQQGPPGYPPYQQGPPEYSPYQQGPPGYPPYQPGPYPQGPHPYGRQQAGMVPGIPGLVSKDGGINILPFSDVYSDIIEKHRNRKLRKRLQRIYDESRSKYRRHGYYRPSMFE